MHAIVNVGVESVVDGQCRRGRLHLPLRYVYLSRPAFWQSVEEILIQSRTANNDVVLNDSGGTCYVPCTKCARCEGIPTVEKRSVNESSEWSAVSYIA